MECATFSPGPSLLSKWRGGLAGELRFQNGRVKAAQIVKKIVEYFVTLHTVKWRFWGFSSAIASRVCFPTVLNRFLNEMKTYHHALRYKILQNFWEYLTFLSRGLSTPARSAILKAEKALGTKSGSAMCCV